MATSNINKMSKANNKGSPALSLRLKKIFLSLLRVCHIFRKVNFILSVGCNNEKKLKLTLMLTLDKVIFY